MCILVDACLYQSIAANVAALLEVRQLALAHVCVPQSMLIVELCAGAVVPDQEC